LQHPGPRLPPLVVSHPAKARGRAGGKECLEEAEAVVEAERGDGAHDVLPMAVLELEIELREHGARHSGIRESEMDCARL
jgi:hypothetical protein